MKVIVGFENIQARDEDGLTTGALCVGDDGEVFFHPEGSVPPPEQASEQIKGSLGEFEEVEEPVPTE